VKAFFAALRFLTPVPVPESWCGGEGELRASPAFYPFVGLVIGGVVAAVGYGLGHVLSAHPASALVVVILVAASGGLHADGLADTADGFFSSRSKERVLEIMRDSRTGAMGVIAIVSVMTIKISLVAAMGGPLRWRTILLMPIAGRCALLLVMALFPYARTDGGLATIFRTGGRRSVLLAAWALLAVLAAGWLAGSFRGVTSAATSVGVALLLALYSRRKIGGYTGDTLGATCEVVELVPALLAAIWAG